MGNAYRSPDGWFVTETVVRQEEYDGGPFDFGAPYAAGSLDRVLGSLQAIRNSIPEPLRATACCGISSISGYQDTHYALIEVTYCRPATELEIADVYATSARQHTVHEEEERATLARLKARYEPT